MSNRVVYKYAVGVEDRITIEMPRGARILCVQMQYGAPWLWAAVDTDEPIQTWRFVLRGTGHPFDGSEGEYVGTFHMHGGALVFHLFEENP